jgi:light-regulated signal transduction histidine kinase (bacteriophytochrome)
LKRKNAELLKRTAQVEAANKELEAFSYSVSHDLRAPARRINGFAQIALDDHGASLEPVVRECLDKVGAAAREMTKLIDDLLAFSRMGRAEMSEIQFGMGDLVNAVLGEIASETQTRNIEWEIRPLPTVRGTPPLLKQVWVNLLSNAIKYTGPRNPARIKVGCVERKSEWEFYVQDNGVGFDMRYAGKLFEVFQRLHRADEFEGTGIGLASVRQIVKRHGGRTWAESRLGEGTTIYFTLPR